MKRSRLALAVLAGLALVGGASVHAQEQRRCGPEDVRTRLRIGADSYERGEPVRFRLSAENTSPTACEMQFPSGRGGTIRVFRDGRRVWEQGYCRAYPDYLEVEMWEPGHRESWSFRWRQHVIARDQKGRVDCDAEPPVAPRGRYRARGIFFGTDPNATTERIPFRLT